tara:strand:+ start:616 stop:942 length:327 start_codon:yes stop_codon:yes gene_type:complete
MSNNEQDVDIQQVVEALLNICGQAAEMQIDEESRAAIYDMCDAVAEHHDIPRVDAIVEEHEGGTTVASYYGEGVQHAMEAELEHTNFKPKLKLVVDNLEDMDDDGTIH